MANYSGKKFRVLCLHGYNTNRKFLEEGLKQWPESVLEMLELVCINGPIRIGDDPPRYSWFETNEDATEFKYFEESIAYLEDRMVELGPFDGVLGMSQGSLVTATLPGMQREGVALKKVPKIKFVIIIAGGKLGGPMSQGVPDIAKNAFSSPIDIPSLHVIGEKDPARQFMFELLDFFVNPILLYHHEGHVVPHLDQNGLKVMLGFLDIVRRVLDKERTKYESIMTCSFCFNLFSAIFRKKKVQNHQMD